jgi:SAM-dependent MidA family methyltransferase
MADGLRAGSRVPGFVEAAQIVLVEASPVLRDRQRDMLRDYEIRHIDTVSELPEGPLFLLANEFFDALPIRQFVRTGKQWRERQVGAAKGKLVVGLGPAQPQPMLAGRLSDTEDGDLIEVCTGLPPIMAELSERIATGGGCAIIVDYGDWRSLGDTLQALRGHEKVDPLDTPGEADLTAHVDFEALTEAAAGCAVTRLTPQGVFLERLGITARAEALATRLSGDALAAHVAAHRRLTHPAEMGNLFKVIALHPKGSAPPPGLET